MPRLPAVRCRRRPHRRSGGHRPASAAEVAQIIVQAYDLTDREQQITSPIARGAGTADIAEELFLSAHAVRGHVKAIFAVEGLFSDGEAIRVCQGEQVATDGRQAANLLLVVG